MRASPPPPAERARVEASQGPQCPDVCLAAYHWRRTPYLLERGSLDGAWLRFPEPAARCLRDSKDSTVTVGAGKRTTHAPTRITSVLHYISTTPIIGIAVIHTCTAEVIVILLMLAQPRNQQDKTRCQASERRVGGRRRRRQLMRLLSTHVYAKIHCKSTLLACGGWGTTRHLKPC